MVVLGMAAAEPVRDPIVLCEDFGTFQEVLNSMRRIDDRIIYALNTTIPTDSFAADIDVQQKCRSLFAQVDKAHTEREVAIRSCINLSASAITELKNQKSVNGSDGDVMRRLRKEQSKLRLIQSELNVEEILKDRTLKVFHDRCKFRYQSSDK